MEVHITSSQLKGYSRSEKIETLKYLCSNIHKKILSIHIYLIRETYSPQTKLFRIYLPTTGLTYRGKWLIHGSKHHKGYSVTKDETPLQNISAGGVNPKQVFS